MKDLFKKSQSNYAPQARDILEDQKLGFSQGGWTPSSSYGLQSARELAWRRTSRRTEVNKGSPNSRFRTGNFTRDALHLRSYHTTDQTVNYMTRTTRGSPSNSSTDNDPSISEISIGVIVTHRLSAPLLSFDSVVPIGL